MWDNVGIVRSNKSLDYAIQKLSILKEKFNVLNLQTLEARNILECGLLIARSAYKRKESRGTHYTIDYPEKKEEWNRHIKVKRDQNDR